MRTTRIFQALTLTSFGLAAYNTVNNVITRKLREQLAAERLKNSEIQEKYEALVNKNIEELEAINASNKTIIENIKTIIDSKSGSSGSNSLLGNNIIDSINQFLLTLKFEQTLAILHLSGALFILISLYIILLIYFGDSLIKYFNLEKSYPKLASFIKLRRKFQNYYIIFNIIIIILILFIIIYINLLLLLTPFTYLSQIVKQSR
jgi:translation initiation factor 2 beta subunit (eIF-2beta)/eIF-5